MAEERLTAEEREGIERMAVEVERDHEHTTIHGHARIILRYAADLKGAEAQLQNERDAGEALGNLLRRRNEEIDAVRERAEKAEARLAELAAAVRSEDRAWSEHRKVDDAAAWNRWCAAQKRLDAALAAAEGQPAPPTEGG